MTSPTDQISHPLLTSQTPKTLTITVGSKNPAKIKSVETTFKKILQVSDPQGFLTLNIIPVSAPSNVNDQPYGDTETRKGAINRAFNAYNLALAETANNTPAVTIDFSVGLEGGVIDDCADYVGDLPGDDNEVLNGGGGTCKPMWCMAWMAVYCPSESTQRRR